MSKRQIESLGRLVDTFRKGMQAAGAKRLDALRAARAAYDQNEIGETEYSRMAGEASDTMTAAVGDLREKFDRQFATKGKGLDQAVLRQIRGKAFLPVPPVPKKKRVIKKRKRPAKTKE